MKKQHFIVVLLFALAALALSSKPRYATTWAGTASNEMVTMAALLDAVNNGVFTANTTIPNSIECVTREQAQQFVNIEPITSRAMNQLVEKSLFIPSTVYYNQQGYFLCFSDVYSTGAGYTSSSAALAHNPLDDYLVGFRTLYNRPLQVGDQVWKTGALEPAVVDDGGPCYATAGYWFYSTSLNAAVRVTATNTGSQYVVEIVYPSGTSNVTICLAVDIVGNTAAVQAIATANVSTNVTINWGYDINGGGSQIGTPFTINSGSNTSNVININNGSTINSMTVSISDFSPSSHGTQNYVSGGQCY